MTDKLYWNNYYKKGGPTNNPTEFAKWCLEHLSGQSILEMGCGNGRDSMYFASKRYNVTAIDQVDTNIKRTDRLEFVRHDFLGLPSDKKYDNIYSRFTLHSVDSSTASRIMKWAYNVLSDKGKLFIEVRTQFDELYGHGECVGVDEFMTTHYRRFIREESIREELTGLGFKIKFIGVSDGWAVFGNENPKVLRCIAER